MIKNKFQTRISSLLCEDKWLILQDHYESKENLKYETLFALANGFMGVRGVMDEGNYPSLPYVYINGVFDKSETFMRELATMPNWTGIKLYVEKELLSVDSCEILEFNRALSMKDGILVRSVILKDINGRETLIESIRFLSRKNVHIGAEKLYVTPLNYSGILEVESITDASIVNFADAPRFKVKHTELVKNFSPCEKISYVQVKTRDFSMNVGVGTKTDIFDNKGNSLVKSTIYNAFSEIGITFLDCDVKEGETVELHKQASFYTECDATHLSLEKTVLSELEKFDSHTINTMLIKHKSVMKKMWEMADIGIDGDFDVERALRFNIFHLMTTANEHSDRLNVGAKLLHGEEYGGHAFWDTELFSLPFFSYVFPDTAKNLVTYRHHLLQAARENAIKNGYKGAQYPWESADTGKEECPAYTIMPDGSCYRCYVADYEHHVSADIVFGGSNYYRITGDENYYFGIGAEIALEIARFWNSRFEYNDALSQYEIHGVTGPDEWHEPVNNNCFTNYLAKWSISYGLELIDTLKLKDEKKCQELMSKLLITEEELKEWKNTYDKVYIPAKNAEGIYEQFEGYFDLIDVTIEKYNDKDMPVRPDILKTMRASKTQLIKQADIVMLMYLLNNEFDIQTQKTNYDYYEKRTLHGSSLSPSIYAIMGLRVGNSSMAYRYLKRAAYLDLYDLQGNTREGFHAANAGGSWKVLVFGFAGVAIDENGILNINPKLPEHWNGVNFKINFRNRLLSVKINKNNEVDIISLSGKEMKVIVNNREIIL